MREANLKPESSIDSLKYSLGWIRPRDRKKIFAVVFLQVGLSLMDLIGVFLIGLVAALSVSTVDTDFQNSKMYELISVIRLQNLEVTSQILILGAISVVVLIGRSLASLFITRKIMYFFSRQSADLSISLTRKLFALPLLDIQRKSSQDLVYSLSVGTQFLMVQVLGTLVVIVADFSVLVLLFIGILVFDPLTAISTLMIFSLVAHILYRVLSGKANNLGKLNASFNIEGNQAINEALTAFREAFVGNRLNFYVERISRTRKGLAEVSGEINFIPFISKYMIEITIILGALVITIMQLFLSDASHAFSALGIFLAAGTRIGPAVLRLQQGVVQIKSSLGMAGPTLNLMEELSNCETLDGETINLNTTHDGFIPSISLSNVSYSYFGSEREVLRGLNLDIPPGTYIAIVGPSGAGKSTLIDLILGIKLPNNGQIHVSGFAPHHAIRNWPGAIGFVPQEVAISDGTILDNVLMGYPIDALTSQEIYDLLSLVELEDFVRNLPNKLETRVGERGSKLSGGQKQRLGIARALVSKPKVLVLDEATSALDGETEAAISTSLSKLRKTMTIVSVAHRINTVTNSDFVVYVGEDGTIDVGTFSELRKRSEAFRNTLQIEPEDD